MALQQPEQTVGNRAYVAPMPVLAVGDDPLVMPQTANFLPRPLQPGIEIADEAGQDSLPGTGADQIEQGAGPADDDGYPIRHLLQRPA